MQQEADPLANQSSHYRAFKECSSRRTRMLQFLTVLLAQGFDSSRCPGATLQFQWNYCKMLQRLRPIWTGPNFKLPIRTIPADQMFNATQLDDLTAIKKLEAVAAANSKQQTGGQSNQNPIENPGLNQASNSASYSMSILYSYAIIANAH